MPGKLGGMSPCPQRAQCALHQRYMTERSTLAGIDKSARVLTRPYIDGKSCHYFKPVA